jgi:hypothetical protein
VLGFVATGDYVTVQPSVIALDLRPDVVAIPLAPPAPRRRLRVQMRRAISRNPATRFIVDSIHALAAKHAEQIAGLVDLGASAPATTGPAVTGLASTDPALLATWSPIVPERALIAVGPVLARENPEDNPVAVDVLATAGNHALSHRSAQELDLSDQPGV